MNPSIVEKELQGLSIIDFQQPHKVTDNMKNDLKYFTTENKYIRDHYCLKFGKHFMIHVSALFGTK